MYIILSQALNVHSFYSHNTYIISHKLGSHIFLYNYTIFDQIGKAYPEGLSVQNIGVQKNTCVLSSLVLYY